jgi:hypothetical protein
MKTFLLTILLTASLQAFAAEQAPPINGNDVADLTGALLRARTDVRKQADLLNDALKMVNTNAAALDFLKALNMKFKVFEGGTNNAATLGVEYNYDKSIIGRELWSGDNSPVLTFTLKAKGNIAFDKKRNPHDFLETGASLHVWQLFGGDSEAETVGSDKMTPTVRTGQKLAHPPFSQMTKQQILDSAEWKAYVASTPDFDAPDFFYDVSGNFSLESNQTFSRKQYAYGGTFQPRLRIWDPSWGKFNIFDWPFAATRSITSHKWEPKGRYLPSPLIGVDLVDGSSDPVRRVADPSDTTFPRLKTEIAFRSKVIEIDEHAIWFNASFRYFRELGATAAIRAADLNESKYWAASLELPWNFMISYTTGRLPFDRKDQQVWALGYKFHF